MTKKIKAIAIAVFLCEIANLAYFSFFFVENNYLPSPFIWDKSNTFMDFYNPLYWVIKNGFYTTYNSIYPALNYYFLKLFTVLWIFPSEVGSPFELRNNNLLLSVMLNIIYCSIIALVINLGEWKKIANKKYYYIIIIFSSPVLFSLERGNLIFLAVMFLALYLNFQNPWPKAIFYAALVNVKPYFILLILFDLNIYRIEIKYLAMKLLFSFGLFLILGKMASINFPQFIHSYLGFSSGAILAWDGFVAMPNTLTSLIFIKNTFISTTPYGSFTFWLRFLKVLSILGPISLLIISLIRPLSRNELIISSLILLANFSIGTGGYIYLIYIILIAYFINSDEYNWLGIFIAIIFCLPLDWVRVIDVFFKIPFPSYLGGGESLEGINVWVSLSSILRPILNFSLMTVFTFKLIKKYGIFKSQTIAP